MILDATIRTSSKQIRVIFIHNKKKVAHTTFLISIVQMKEEEKLTYTYTNTGNGQTVTQYTYEEGKLYRKCGSHI